MGPSLTEIEQKVERHSLQTEEAEERLESSSADLAKAMEQTAYQESKMEDLENRSQRNLYFEIINDCLGPRKVLELAS